MKSSLSVVSLLTPDFRLALYDLCHRAGELVASGGQGYPLLLTGDVYTLDLHREVPGKGLRCATLTDKNLWVVGEYGGVAKSDDGGTSWVEVDAKCGNACLYSVIEDARGWIWVGGDGGALAVSKDGEKFKRVKGIEGTIRRMTRTSSGEVLIPTAKPGELHIMDAKGKISKTSLSVESFLNKSVRTPQGTLLVVGDGGALFRSEDQGDSFTRVDAGHQDINFETIALFADGRVLIAGGKGLILVSSDDGQTFEQVEHNAMGGTIWASVPYEEGMLLGADAGVILGVDIPSSPALHDPHHFGPVSIEPDPREQEIPEHWRSPVLSEASWRWEPEEKPVEVVNDLYLSPRFLKWLVPRHGGLQTQIRPLPTREEAWGELQRAVWAASRAAIEKEGDSPIWGYISSTDRVQQEFGLKLSSAEPVELSRADFEELLRRASKQSGSSSMPELMSIENNARIVDYMVLCLGLEEAIRVAFSALYELAYSHTNAFERLRELTATLDDAAYARTQEVIFEAYQVKVYELANTQGYVGQDRLGDLRWAATYMLPYSMQTPNELELFAHRDAMRGYLKKFGDSGTHAAGLASGDLHTFESYLKVNSGLAHQFFFPGPRLYLASILEREGGAACAPMFSTLRPASPWTKDVRYNQFTCTIMAHIKSDTTWGELVRRAQDEEMRAFGLYGLEVAASLDHARLMDVLEAEGASELVDTFADRGDGGGKIHQIHLNTTSRTSPTHPYSLTPPQPPYVPKTMTPSFAPEPELRYTDEERERIIDDDLWPSYFKFEGTRLRSLDEAQLERFIAFYERWRHPVSIELLYDIPREHHARLIENGFELRRGDIDLRLNQLLCKYGMEYFKIMLWGMEQEDNGDLRLRALAHSLPVADARITPFMLELFSKKTHKILGAKWLRRHPEHAIAGMIGMLGEQPEHAEAIRGLLYLERFGHREIIDEMARKADQQELIREIMERDPLTPKLKKKIKLPAYADPAKLPDLITTKDGKPASADEVETFLYRFAFSNEDEPHPEILRARDTYTSQSRAAFVWALFQAWLDDDAPAKQQWCLQAVGFWGDDQCVHDLAQLAKKWPGEGAGKRAQWALAALANTGLESALILINLLAEKSKFAAFKETAARFIAQIAEQRGLSREELSDRLAPTLDLDEDGVETLDFGPRQFTVRFDESLMPFVMDASSKRLKSLPKANSADDAALAREAHKKFKALKKEAKVSASLHTFRFEMIMASQRPIPSHIFKKFFVEHPWMTHLTQRLVWMTEPGSSSGVQHAFRVSVEQSLVDSQDEEMSLEDVEFVTIAHPIHLSPAQLDTWRTLFADYELIQPFEQLTREVFTLTEAQRQATEIDPPNVSEETHFRKLLALEKRRWHRYEDGCIEGMTRKIDATRNVTLFVQEGWFPYVDAEDIDPQAIGQLRLYAPEGVSFGAIDAAMMSEILRDVVRLTE